MSLAIRARQISREIAILSIPIIAGWMLCSSPADPKPLEKAPLRVLLVLAHPDDETMIGSVLIRLNEMHADVRAIYATDGEGGKDIRVGKNETSEELGKIRSNELHKSALAFGINHVYQLHQPDSPFRGADGKPSRDAQGFMQSKAWEIDELTNYIRVIAQEFEPEFVITMSLDTDAHAHHKTVRIITESLYNSKKLGPDTQGLYAISEEHWIKTGSREPRNRTLEFDSQCGTYAARAFTAAQNHESQLPGHTGPIPENEVIYKINGDLNPFLKEVSRTDSCHPVLKLGHS